ncbi:MAG: HlyC/CorC family transporter [Clostridia bacterium]|nr:HlyC/CorC family transporter [Clostridia bacterium]
MDTVPLLSIISLVLLIIFSAFFSASETAFSSLNRIRLKNMASDGDKKAARALSMSERFDSLISIILIGNNIVNILATSIATVMFIGILKNSAKGTTVATVVITAAVLIFGEITPKTLAKKSPEAFAIFAAPILRCLFVVLYPLYLIFYSVTKLLAKLFPPKEDKGITEDELLTIVEEAETEGDMDKDEVELIRNAIEFNDIEVKDILQPRVEVVATDLNSDTWEDVDRIFRETGYSRIPAYKDSIDNIVGVINQKDFYMSGKKSLSAITKNIIYVVPTMKISEVMVKLQKNKSHMAVVVDEYGGTDGIITLEDIIEELVGEIWDEHDEIINEFEKISEDEYRVLCTADLDDLFELLDIEDELDIPSVSGWVIEELKKVPDVGDSFTYENLLVTVTKCDNKHVLEIIVKVLPVSEDDEDGD